MKDGEKQAQGNDVLHGGHFFLCPFLCVFCVGLIPLLCVSVGARAFCGGTRFLCVSVGARASCAPPPPRPDPPGSQIPAGCTRPGTSWLLGSWQATGHPLVGTTYAEVQSLLEQPSSFTPPHEGQEASPRGVGVGSGAALAVNKTPQSHLLQAPPVLREQVLRYLLLACYMTTCAVSECLLKNLEALL
jgi:hypothetical protein